MTLGNIANLITDILVWRVKVCTDRNEVEESFINRCSLGTSHDLITILSPEPFPNSIVSKHNLNVIEEFESISIYEMFI